MEDTIKEKQYILNEARTLFEKNKNVSVQLVNDSASSEDPHQPGDGSQARESFQRSLSSHTVPVASHSHKRCAVKFFFQYRNFKTSKYKPIQREKNRIVPFVTWL